MLGKIQDELANMIATELYDYAKKKSAEIQKELKNTGLRRSGVGLPPPLLVAFLDSFLSALSFRMFSKDGYARWPYKSEEHEFKLLLREPLVARIQQTDWVKAANHTEEGARQVKVLGGA